MNRYLIRSVEDPAHRPLTINSEADLIRKVDELSGFLIGKIAAARARMGDPTHVLCKEGSEGFVRFGERGFEVEPVVRGMKPQPLPKLQPYLAREVSPSLRWPDTPCMLAIQDGITLLDDTGQRNAVVALMNALYPTTNEGDLKSMHN